MLVGVAAAGLMGVGLGLWARPAMSERQVAVAELPTADPAGPRSIQIVLEDTPAPLGKLIEVLPAGSAAPKFVVPTERMAPEPLAPVRRLAGLVRVQAVEPEPVEPVASPPKVFPKAFPRAAPKPELKVVAKPVEKPKAKLVKAAAPKAKAKPIRIEPVRIEPVRIGKVKLAEEAQVKPAKTKVVKAEAKPDKSTVRLAKAEHRENDGRREKAGDVEKVVAKQPGQLSGSVHVAERPAHKAEAPTKVQKEVQLEKPKAKPAKAVAKARVKTPSTAPAKSPAKPPAKAAVEKAAVKAKPAPAPAPKPIRGAGPVRYAKAMPRPDTTVNDADRQMNRAYTTARAAGVPDWQLRRQQARWEQARAAAAREAPWAVHDVYLARIAQLHDLTKDAKAPGY